MKSKAGCTSKLVIGAPLSLQGVFQIQNSHNVQFGNNYKITTEELEIYKPPESKLNYADSYKALLDNQNPLKHEHRYAVSVHIGSDWRNLGHELAGFSDGQMDQMQEQFKANLIPFDEMIYQLIQKWEEQSLTNPTIGKLAHALLKCGMTPALDFLSKIR